MTTVSETEPLIVDFYLLRSADDHSLINFICKLTEKIFRQGNSVLIWCPDDTIAQELNQQLYSFRSDSFLPHQHFPEKVTGVDIQQSGFPIIITGEQVQLPAGWIVINLAETCFPEPRRIVEIVINDEAAKSLSRSKFLKYKEKGADLRTHKL